MRNFLGKFLKRITASFLFLGYIPGAPGTYGAIAATGGIWYLNRLYPSFFGPDNAAQYWLVAVALTGFAAWVSNGSNEVFGRFDAKQIIIDEGVGIFITFMAIPLTWRTMLLGLLLFRFYDIVKPFPVHKFEELDDGLGVTMDDVAAGVLANLSLFLILGIYHGIKSFL